MNYPELSSEEKQRRAGRAKHARKFINPEKQKAAARKFDLAGKMVASGHIKRLGDQNVETGFLESITTPETLRAAGKATLAAGAGVHDPVNAPVVVAGQNKGRCTRWNIQRGKLCVCGQH